MRLRCTSVASTCGMTCRVVSKDYESGANEHRAQETKW